MRLTLPAAIAAALTAGTLAVTAVAAARASAPPAGRLAHTQVTVVRPVDSSGHPATGWTVRRSLDITLSCYGPAPAAVDDKIALCSPSAAYAPACWRSGHHTVLCLRDVRGRELVRMRYSGAFPTVTAPPQPSPQGLDLAGTRTCDIRVGGAWGQVPSHPSWLGFYSCSTGSVYGPPTGDGINRHHAVWRVHTWSGRGDRVTTREVRAAYAVGTAG